MRLVALRDLDLACRSRLCRRLHAEVLVPAFPVAAELEEADVLLARLNGDPPPPEPRSHILVALDSAGEPVGGVVGEFYRGAQAGLVTYVAVAPGQRRSGLARRLTDGILGLLADEAASPRPPVFAEAEDPARAPAAAAAAGIDLRARLAALGRLGFAETGLPYVQPPLGVGKPPVRWLRFLVHRGSLAPGAHSLPAECIRRFLDEFYRALGSDPGSDGDFLAMSAWLDRHPLVTLKSLP